MPDNPSPFIPLEGGCACKKLRYRIEASPLVVHCCHCTLCQRETGTAFALNYVIEAEKVVITEGEEDMLLIDMPTDSGRPQITYGNTLSQRTLSFDALGAMSLGAFKASVESKEMTKLTKSRVRCPRCYIPTYSNYGTARDLVRFVRSGTLDEYPRWVKPDIHIYTCSKQPWVVIPEGIRTEERYYDIKTLWSKEALHRWDRILDKVKGRTIGKEGRGGQAKGVVDKMDEMTLKEKGKTSEKPAK